MMMKGRLTLFVAIALPTPSQKPDEPPTGLSTGCVSIEPRQLTFTLTTIDSTRRSVLVFLFQFQTRVVTMEKPSERDRATPQLSTHETRKAHFIGMCWHSIGVLVR